MFGARNVVRPSARGGKGGRPIQAPMRGKRRGTVKASTQARLFDPSKRIDRALGLPARSAQSMTNKLASSRGSILGSATRSPQRGRGRGMKMVATGRGRGRGSILGRAARAARRPQYKRR